MLTHQVQCFPPFCHRQLPVQQIRILSIGTDLFQVRHRCFQSFSKNLVTINDPCKQYNNRGRQADFLCLYTFSLQPENVFLRIMHQFTSKHGQIIFDKSLMPDTDLIILVIPWHQRYRIIPHLHNASLPE